MTLANFREGRSWLVILIASVFISAGVVRLLNPAFAQTEMDVLGLPRFVGTLIAVFEIVGGLAVLAGGRYRRYALSVFGVFLALAISLGFYLNAPTIVAQAGELFVFDPSPTDIFLHVVFLIIIISLLIRR